jgi:DNA-binding transcriptional ArsR family regulator
MSKIMLDLESFKALASESRLDILKSLDGKKMNLKDISKMTNLNKATLHVHLSKLLDAGFIKKKERDGHKWVYYKLTWKGASLLHPENNRVVVLFSITFFSLFFGIIQLFHFAKGTIVGLASTSSGANETQIFERYDAGINIVSQNQMNFRQVAEVPVQNQSIVQLSNTLQDNARIRGIMDNVIPDSEIRWNAIKTTREMVFDSADVSPDASNVVATIQDPILFYIAITCFVIFTIVLSVSLWRLWENRTSKI